MGGADHSRGRRTTPPAAAWYPRSLASARRSSARLAPHDELLEPLLNQNTPNALCEHGAHSCTKNKSRHGSRVAFSEERDGSQLMRWQPLGRYGALHDAVK